MMSEVDDAPVMHLVVARLHPQRQYIERELAAYVQCTHRRGRL